MIRGVRRPRRPSIRGLLVLLVCLLVVALAVAAGAGWYYSNEVLAVSRAPRPYDVRVATSGSGVVTLSRTQDSARDGVFGLSWQGGAAVLGAVRTTSAGTVTRRLLSGDVPPPGTRGRLETQVWLGDPQTARGLGYEDVAVPVRAGPMPAWLVRARSRTWVVAVHGRGSTRREALRVMPALRRLQLPVLAISYRNDVGAPPSGDRLYHLGDTEWRDVDAAVRYAQTQGARRIVLYGWSMGGALITAFLEHSPLARTVVATVLDAPVLDWRATLALQGKNRDVPGPLTTLATAIVARRIGIDWDDFDLDDHPGQLRVPTLLFHGQEDATVPIAPARRLAARNRQVTFVAVPRAGHTQEWNVDPAGYERRLTGFLRPFAGTPPP